MDVNYTKIKKLLEDCASKVFDEAIKGGDYFQSLKFEVRLDDDAGGFESVLVHRTKRGFFESGD